MAVYNSKMPSNDVARLSLVDHDRQFTFKHKRVLCVCSAGMLRSATMAWMLSNNPYNFNTRACGVEPFALVVLDQVLYHWADYVVFADQQHRDAAFTNLGKRDNVFVVGVKDVYNYRDPALLSVLDVKFNNFFGDGG